MKAALALVLLMGCAEHGEAPALHTDLRPVFADGDNTIKPVGVAVTPDGTRYVFEERRGLYELDGATGKLVVAAEGMPALPAGVAPVKLPFTDMVALDNGLFALTAIGDGYLLDINAMTLAQHFCYVVPTGPGDGGSPAPTSDIQRTDAVTFDAAKQIIYAQPNTFDAAEVYQYGQIAGYDRATGEDREWASVTPELNAAGMAVLPEQGLVFGQGTRLVSWDVANFKVVDVADLEHYGVERIGGLAVDPVTQSLLVVDDVSDELIDISLARLAQP